MQLPSLQKMPGWVASLPWVVVSMALLLSLVVIGISLSTARRETRFATQLTLEKGTSLISALEGALRTGMGFRWSDIVLSDLLEKIGEQPDITSLLITHRNGVVLMASDKAQIGTTFLSSAELSALAPDQTVRWNIAARPNGTAVFQVYKTFSVPPRERRRHARQPRHHGAGMMEMPTPPFPERPERSERPERPARPTQAPFTDFPLPPLTGQTLEDTLSGEEPLLLFVEYDLTPLEKARAADEKHRAVLFTVLLFTGVVGIFTMFLVRGYRRSRRMVQETTAFSSEILRTLPVGIVAVNQEDKLTSINPTALDIAGLSKETVLGRPLRDALPGIWTLLEGLGRDIQEREVWCHMNGRRVPLALSVSRIVTEEGVAVGTAVIMRDLGELRQLQSELRRRDRLASLGNMAAGIAHEIRNPLGAIKGLARFFMEATPPDSEESRMANIMTDEVLRLDKVVGDLLDFARPDVLNLTELSLPELVERARNMVQADLNRRNIHFTTDFPPQPLTVRLDKDRMTQVLLNLFLNAVQAMPEGGTLCAAARLEGTELHIEITDTGHGIPAGHLSDIFSPYFTTKAKGTGLGLSIVHKIVEAHDGTIEVASSSEKGTTFSLRFPCVL